LRDDLSLAGNLVTEQGATIVKTGRTLTELATELERQSAAKRDFVADTRELAMMNGSEIHVTGQGEFPVRSLAHAQISDHLSIPRKYYDRLKAEHPTLLDSNVNTLLRANPQPRLVRTLDGEMRAFLSNRYRRLDNDELAQAIFPVLAEIPGVQFPSMEVTEKRLYIKAVAPQITGEVKVGDIVQAGVVISNSEVGEGSLSVQGLIFRLVCLNGLITDVGMRRYHVGRSTGDGGEDAAYELFKDETLQADDRAFFLKVRDVVAATVSQARFEQTLAALRMAAGTEPMVDPSKGVQELGRRFDLAETEMASVLHHLALGGDLTKYGALNAVTRASQDVESYDRATELEVVGGHILAMPSAEWRSIVSVN
jgi:hypothetical protein